MSRDALVVGVGKYRSLASLGTPANDADEIAQRLQTGGFRVWRLPEVDRSGVVNATTLENLIVQRFLPDPNEHIPTTALLYFSGHGLRRDRGITEGYLATSDVDQRGNWGIQLKWLREILQQSRIQQQVIWLDCCHSGELFNFDEANPGDNGKDRCFIAASRRAEAAYEAIDGHHSVMTAALLDALDAQTANPITDLTISDHVDRVLKAADVIQSPLFRHSGNAIEFWRNGAAAAAAPSVDQATQQAICPYRGLEFFKDNEEDPQFFHGRRALTDQLLDRVRQSDFLAIVGASGNGKSSVLRAGLLHQLRLGRRLSGSDRWQLLPILQPGERPLQRLAAAFVDQTASQAERATQLGAAEQAIIQEGATGLRRLVQASHADRVVLAIDQFEESFTLCRGSQAHEQERQQFFQCLLEALPQTGGKLCLILAMRADFFGKCLEQDYSGLARQIQDHLVTVTPMSREELRQAIEQPAQQVNLAIEPELVIQMLTDVEGSPGSLPLLQYTLTELWKQRTEAGLRLGTYAQLGGVMGTLQKRATAVYDAFSPEQQAIVQHIFLALTQLGEGTEDTRRRVRKADLVTSRYTEGAIDPIVQKLADEKLIVTGDGLRPTEGQRSSGTERVAVVDVAHEALIRHWSLLRKWLDENREKLRQKRKIEAAAEEWETQRKSKDYLLQGKALTQARAFQKEQANNLTLSSLTERFIKVSLRQRRSSQMTIAGIVAIPILITFAAVIPELRQERYDRAWNTIEKRGEGTREALEVLNEGCPAEVELGWMPDRVRRVLFGDCPDVLRFLKVDLSGINLSFASLSNANLDGVILIKATLFFADLGDARLSFADLSNANLSDAILLRANLGGANLSNASLRGAFLEDADLRAANLRGADLKGAFLNNTNLTGTTLYLTSEQVKVAQNWEEAIYDKEFCQRLALKDCRTKP